MLKTESIDWNGKPAEIQYEDDIPWGVLQKILSNTIDITKVISGNVIIKREEYVIQILLNALKTAPFPISVKGINDLGHKQMQKVVDVVMNDYALETFLEKMIETFTGSQEMKTLLSDSIHTAQSNSDGRRNKQTDNPESG